MAIPRPKTAQQLMAHWQREHDDPKITGHLRISNQWESKKAFSSIFSDAVELLCQAVEKRSIHKLMNVTVEGRSAIGAVLDAAERLPNINSLILRKSRAGRVVEGQYRKQAKLLSECIDKGSFRNLSHFQFDCAQDVNDNGVVLSALATGKAPNLVSVLFHGYCDSKIQEEIAKAISNKDVLPKLRSLSPSIKLKNHLRTLSAPEDFADEENEEILAFLQERWNHGEVELGTKKVIVMGPSGVGKTSLVNCLMGNSFVPDMKSTNTMEVGRQKVTKGLELMYYDFGGKRVYVTPQHLALLRSAIYVVVWDRHVQTGGDTARDQYARDVLDVFPKAKILFVTAKGDLKVSKPLTDIEQAQLEKQYGESFQGYHHVSAKHNTGFDKLMEAIKSTAFSATVLMPRPYEELRELMMNHQEHRAKKIPQPATIWDFITPEVILQLRHLLEKYLQSSHLLEKSDILSWKNVTQKGSDILSDAVEVASAITVDRNLFHDMGESESLSTDDSDEKPFPREDGEDNPHRWYVTGDQWDDLCKKAGITGKHRIRLVERVFQSMGDLVRLSSGHVIVQKSALIGVLSKVVAAEQENNEMKNARSGYLYHSKLEKTWSAYPEELRAGLLDAIRDYGVGFPMLRNDNKAYTRKSQQQKHHQYIPTANRPYVVQESSTLEEEFAHPVHPQGTSEEAKGYMVTLIPLMLPESSGDVIAQVLERLNAGCDGFETGPQIVVELSNLSDLFWSKLLINLKGQLVMGAWGRTGCVVIGVRAQNTNPTLNVTSFGEVSWDSKTRTISLSKSYGRAQSSLQLLRSRTFTAIWATLKDFPGVSFKRLRMRPFPTNETWIEESSDDLFRSVLDTTKFKEPGALDVAEFLMKLREERQRSETRLTDANNSFSFFGEMLQEDSGASDELVSYLSLTHQKDMLEVGRDQGRLNLSALWLIYRHDGSLVAYPLSQHLNPKKIRVERDLRVSDVSGRDLQVLNEDQKAVKSLVMQMNKRLGILSPENAEFLGIVWHARDEKYVSRVHHYSASEFQPVLLDGLTVFVHGKDREFFTDPIQVKANEELITDLKRSIQCQSGCPHYGPYDYFVGFVLVVLLGVLLIFVKNTMHRRQVYTDPHLGTEKADTSGQTEETLETEVRRFKQGPFNWLSRCFRDGERRRQYMASVLEQVPITNNIANDVKHGIQGLFEEEFHTFYPKVIISYSTGHREGDANNAGPGLMVAAAVINHLFEMGYPCYSDIMTPPGRNWEEYMLRIKEADVMVVILTRELFTSVHCMREVAEAVTRGIELLPIRLHSTSKKGIDIEKDENAMWPDKALEKYARKFGIPVHNMKLARYKALRLVNICTVPNHGTLLSEPVAVDDLVKRVSELVTRPSWWDSLKNFVTNLARMQTKNTRNRKKRD